MNPLELQLHYPHGESLPEPGHKIAIADGVYWIRMPLPFALNHINLWLLRDHHEGREGWTVVDCGVGTDETRKLWEKIVADQLDGLPIVRVICTHMHPDHLGNAGWLTDRFDARLWMSLGDYTMGRLLQASMPGADTPRVMQHFIANGLDPKRIEISQRSTYFSQMVPSMPLSYRRIMDGDTLTIGARSWRVIAGFGHSPEHASLFTDDGRILIAGDMLLPRISTNIGVHAIEPDANPLQQFMDSLCAYLPLPEDAVVLPAHGRVFARLQVRVGQLLDHHNERLDEVRQLCRRGPATASEVVPIMFKRELDNHQMFFAFTESLAHLHQLWYAGELKREIGADGVKRFCPA